MGRRWIALLLGLGACYRPEAIRRPSDEDALFVVDGEEDLRAILFEGPAAGRNLTLIEGARYLWLEYPPGSLTTFLDQAAATAGVVDGLAPNSEAWANASRALPEPVRALEWTGAEWSTVADVPAQPTFARFRLPVIDPFECAALGGCFEPSSVDGEGDYPPCGPCAEPEPPAPPEPPRPPDLGPCLPTWTATTVAGFAACAAPPPCDPAATPATCAPLADCPSRTIESIEASMRIGGLGCGDDDWPCDLAAGLGILARDRVTTATIALSEGEHRLTDLLSVERLVFRGLCPSRTRLLIEGTVEATHLGLEDLSLLGTVTLDAAEVSIVNVVSRASLVLEGDLARITDSLFLDAEINIRSAATTIDRSRLDGVTLVTGGPITFDGSVLSRMASIHHVAGQFTLRASTLEVPGQELDCSDAAMAIRGSTIQTWGSRLTEGDVCVWDLAKVWWDHRSVAPSPRGDAWVARDLRLVDVLLTARGDPLPALLNSPGEVSLTAVAVVAPILQGLDLRDAPSPQIEDLELRFLADTSVEGDPDDTPIALRSDSKASLVLRRAKIVGPSGMAIDFQSNLRAGQMPGFSVIEDLEIKGARLAGIGASFSVGRIARLRVEDVQGSALNLYTEGTWEALDVSVRKVRAIPGGCRRFVGRSCEGTGLITQVVSRLDVDRFVVEDTQGPAIVVAGATGSLRQGWIRSPLAFFLDRYAGREEGLLVGVHVDVGESGTILERGE